MNGHDMHNKQHGSDLIFLEELCKPRRLIAFHGLEDILFEFKQSQGNSLHNRIWPSAIVLSQFLVDNPSLHTSTSCLELGCGLGLVAQVASSMKIHTVATDKVLPSHLTTNNFLDILEFDFCGDEIPHKEFDLILGADIVYGGVDTVRLAKTIHRLLLRNPKAKCILCQQVRDIALLRDFVDVIAPTIGCNVVIVDYDRPHDGYYHTVGVEYITSNHILYTVLLEIKCAVEKQDPGVHL